MMRALDGLQHLQQRAASVGVTGHREYNPGWHTALDLTHLLTVSEAITRSARQRTESRGAHSRLDHPATDDTHWSGVNSVIFRGKDGAMSVGTTPLPAMTPELRSLLGTSDH